MNPVTVKLPKQFLARVEKSALPPAVVVGTDVTGLTVARAIARHGVAVVGVDEKRRRYTGYSGAFQLLQLRHFQGPEFIDALSALAATLPRKAALFLSMDEHVKLVGSLGQHLQHVYYFEFPDQDTVDLLMNKRRFAELAAERGWPIPRTIHFETEQALMAKIDELRFPVILKPQIKNQQFRSHTPQKAFRCRSAAELLREYRLIAQWEPEAIVSEWIPGGDDEVYFSFHYLDHRLDEIAVFEGRKLRQWVPECGSTSMAVGVAEPRVTDLSRQILTETRCVGFGAVEYKRDPRNGVFYITEPTVGRVNLQVGVAIANNVDTVARAYFHLISREYPARDQSTHDRKWVLAASDFRAARFYVQRGDLSWGDYFRSLRGPKQFAVWRTSDPQMLLGPVWHWAGKPSRLVRRLISRVRGSRLHEQTDDVSRSSGDSA